MIEDEKCELDELDKIREGALREAALVAAEIAGLGENAPSTAEEAALRREHLQRCCDQLDAIYERAKAAIDALGLNLLGKWKALPEHPH